MDPIDKRVEMINGHFDLPPETVEAMKEIRVAAELCARTMQGIFKKHKADTGRAIATIDQLQAVKNTACDALILPHAK
jgi:hypothetical protein